MSVSGFEHRLAAHCESGVTRSLLRHAGLELSEPLAFGIGSGLFFLHLPFDSFFGAPTTSFRSSPGSIFKKVCDRLNLATVSRTFGSQDAAEKALVDLIAQQQ